MASVFDNPELISARKSAQGAESVVARESAVGKSLPDMLRETLNKKFSESPTIKQREGALTDYMTQTTDAPLRVTPKSAGGMADVLFSPLQQASLIEKYRAPATARLSTLNTLLGIEQGGLGNVIESTGRAHEGLVEGLLGEAKNKRQIYADLLSEMAHRADEAYKNQSLALEREKLRIGGATGRTTALLRQVAEEARSGKKLKEIMQKFGVEKDVTPDEILRVYNTNSIYGSAKESPEELQRLYGVRPTETAETRNRRAALKPAFSTIQGINEMDIDQLGPQHKVSRLFLQYAGGAGVPKNIKNLNAKFATLRQNVVRGMQGARMSDKDIELAEQYIPTIEDTPENARAKLDNLRILLEDLGVQTENGGRPPLSSFEY